MPVLLGVLALYRLARDGRRDAVAYILAALTLLTGAGSVAWHALRTELTLTLDALPGVVYFLVFVVFWVVRLRILYAGLAITAALVGLGFLLPPMDRQEIWTVIVVSVAATAAGLLVATRYRAAQAFSAALLTVGLAAVALAARALDDAACSAIPFGTHFLWHVFLGFAAYAGVETMLRLRAGKTPEKT